MRISANYTEIERVRSVLSNKTSELEKNIHALQQLVQSLSTCWSGVDSATFVQEASTYLNRRQREVTELYRVAKGLELASKRYSHKDVEWQEHMQRSGLDDE